MLNGEAEAMSHGAATIINAIATGKGAALGVDLWTRARVKLTDEVGSVHSTIVSDPAENPVLIEKTVNKVLEHFGLEGQFGAEVETRSNIPIARGLKSSSAAANAVALATVAALGKRLNDVTIVGLGVEAGIEAKVTVTGAYDDACASYFGGAVVTDNLNRRIIKRAKIASDMAVLFHVPAKKVYTADSDIHRMKNAAWLVEVAFREALEGKHWLALTLNGLIYSSVLGFDPAIAVDALAAGAVAAGLSGKGPAVTAIVPDEKKDLVKEAWHAYEGQVLEARISNEKAKVVD
jgi:shikimate kinase